MRIWRVFVFASIRDNANEMQLVSLLHGYHYLPCPPSAIFVAIIIIGSLETDGKEGLYSTRLLGSTLSYNTCRRVEEGKLNKERRRTLMQCLQRTQEAVVVRLRFQCVPSKAKADGPLYCFIHSLHAGCLHACMLSHFSCVWLFVTPWTITHQDPLSMGFSRQEYWSGLPSPPPGELPDSGIEPTSLIFLSSARGLFTTGAYMKGT